MVSERFVGSNGMTLIQALGWWGTLQTQSLGTRSLERGITGQAKALTEWDLCALDRRQKTEKRGRAGVSQKGGGKTTTDADIPLGVRLPPVRSMV